MAKRVISTAIQLEGDKEYREQLSAVNRELKNASTEMQLLTERYHGQANSMEYLTEKDKLLRREIEQQEEKVRSLNEAVEKSAEYFGETDARTDKYRQSLNRAQTDLIKMQRELDQNNQYLDEARKSADKAASSIDEFGREVKDAGDDIDDAGGGIGDFMKDLDDLKGMLVGGAVVAGVKELADKMFEVVDASAEYRTIMGQLEVSSERAGYTAEQTAEVYGRLQGVLGDTEAAATATANLQAIGLEQEALMMVVDSAIGGWATYGSSIPIDSLAEGINETIRAGTATSAFADILVWAGVNEDEFNAKLQAANSTTERANIVMQELSRQGLDEAGQAFIQNNESLIELNESQERMNKAMADLGEALTPVANTLRNVGAAAIEDFTELVKGAVEWVGNLIDKFNEWSRTGARRQAQDIIDAEKASFGNINGSHSSGLDYVPFDGYIAELHKGERVQTAAEAALSRSLPREGQRQSGISEASLATVANQAAAQAAGAMSNRPIEVHTTIDLDGRTVARNQYRHNQNEAQRHGESLVKK